MTRGSLGVVATILAGLMVVVATAGLDDLPRSLRTSVTSASARLDSDRRSFEENHQAILKAEKEQPELFASRAATLEARLKDDQARLDQAAAQLAAVQQIAKANRRSDSENVEKALREFDRLRSEPVSDSASLKDDAERAVYEKLHPFDKEGATATARKAMVDWPEKKSDIESRLGSVRDRASAEQLNSLVGQLYYSWDKLLLDVDGSRQRVRLVKTRDGSTTTEERSEYRPAGIGREAEGMVIEHKPTGKYDSESERNVQYPAHAYIAPPGQSNSYGHWVGDVWQWLPAYIILSQVLHSARAPITVRDYQGWHEAYRRGVPPVISAPLPRPSTPGNSGWKSPGGQQSSSGWWKERPKETPRSWSTPTSKPPSGGTFGSSPYRSRGSFGGSKYQSRGGFRSFGGGRR